MKLVLPRIPRKVTVSLIAVFLGLVAGALFMLTTGSNPFAGYMYLFRGGLMNIERIGNTLATATPLIFTGLSVAFAFNTGLFNIGASGQLLVGGLCATAVGLTMVLPKPLLLLIMLIAAIAGGALWGFLPGLLKALFNVHEVVATIMMNWLAYWLIYYTIPAYFKGEFMETESRRIPEFGSLRVPWLSELFDGSFINLGIFLAAIVVMVIWVILNKTVIGYELKAAGFNRHAAEYAGMKVNRNIVLSMTIAGGLAGLGGMAMYAGYAVNILEDLDALVVVPVVENELHEINVGGRYGVEHVATDESAAVGNTKFGRPKLSLAGDNAGQIENDSRKPGIFGQDVAQQMPVASSDIA